MAKSAYDDFSSPVAGDDYAAISSPVDQAASAPAPKPHTFLEGVGLGGRALMQGAAGFGDALMSVANLPVNAARVAMGQAPMKTNSLQELATSGADLLQLAKPETPLERFQTAIGQGVGGAAAGAGIGSLVQGAPGAIGAVGHALADAPVKNLIAGATGGASSDLAAKAGGGPIAQLAAGLAGGVAGFGGAAAVESAAARVATKFGPQAARIVETVPREAVLNEKGHLTDEGRELSAQHDIPASSLKGAYEEAAQPASERPPAPVNDAAPIAPDAAPVAAPDAVAPEAVAPPVAEPAASVAEAPAPVFNASPEAPANTAGRIAEAQSEGVDLTKGQATKDFSTQEQEQGLAAQSSPEGQQVRDHFAKQGEQITAAVDRFKAAFGDTTLNATDRGQIVKDSLRALRDQGKAGVSALYKQAQEAAQKLGEAGSNLIKLDTAPLLAKMRELFIDEAIPEGTRKALKQQAAKYGLLGENPRHVEGETTVQVRDDTGELVRGPTFTGKVEPLTVVNAEKLRQSINNLYDTTKPHNPQEALKPVLDDAVQQAVERAAAEAPGGVGDAFKAARAGHQTQIKTFKGGDIIQKVIDWKNGNRGTDALKPEDAIRAVFAGGPEGLTNLRKMKAVLLSSQTSAGKAAWRAIQAHGIADIFKQAVGPNDTISGLRLNTAIKKFGPDKLKVLLTPDEFNQLMKLRRIIGDATIPLPRTTNPSGSGYAVIRFLSGQAKSLAPVAKMVPLARDVVKGAEEFGAAREAKSTAAGVTRFTGETRPPAGDPAGFARKYLSLAGSDRLLAPVLSAAANEDRP